MRTFKDDTGVQRDRQSNGKEHMTWKLWYMGSRVCLCLWSAGNEGMEKKRGTARFWGL